MNIIKRMIKSGGPTTVNRAVTSELVTTPPYGTIFSGI